MCLFESGCGTGKLHLQGNPPKTMENKTMVQRGLRGSKSLSEISDGEVLLRPKVRQHFPGGSSPQSPFSYPSSRSLRPTLTRASRESLSTLRSHQLQRRSLSVKDISVTLDSIHYFAWNACPFWELIPLIISFQDQSKISSDSFSDWKQWQL